MVAILLYTEKAAVRFCQGLPSLDDRMTAEKSEESRGNTERFWLTASKGDFRDSVTETNRSLYGSKGEKVV